MFERSADENGSTISEHNAGIVACSSGGAGSAEARERGCRLVAGLS